MKCPLKNESKNHRIDKERHWDKKFDMGVEKQLKNGDLSHFWAKNWWVSAPDTKILGGWVIDGISILICGEGKLAEKFYCSIEEVNIG